MIAIESDLNKSTGAIVWHSDDQTFSIMNLPAFTGKIIPLFFKEIRYASFVRRLFRWGFQSSSKSSECGYKSFHHDLFRKGRYDLAMMIRRPTLSKKSKAQKQTKSQLMTNVEHARPDSDVMDIPRQKPAESLPPTIKPSVIYEDLVPKPMFQPPRLVTVQASPSNGSLRGPHPYVSKVETRPPPSTSHSYVVSGPSPASLSRQQIPLPAALDRRAYNIHHPNTTYSKRHDVTDPPLPYPYHLPNRHEADCHAQSPRPLVAHPPFHHTQAMMNRNSYPHPTYPPKPHYHYHSTRAPVHHPPQPYPRHHHTAPTSYPPQPPLSYSRDHGYIHTHSRVDHGRAPYYVEYASAPYETHHVAPAPYVTHQVAPVRHLQRHNPSIAPYEEYRFPVHNKEASHMSYAASNSIERPHHIQETIVAPGVVKKRGNR